jgi:PTH1 family peptidyl-tRNA hydrolase
MKKKELRAKVSNQKKNLKKVQKNNNLLIIGLGNPGEKYRKTRHNAGFAVIDKAASILNIKLRKVFLRPLEYGSRELNGCTLHLVKPLTYMNRSGEILDYIIKKTSCGMDELIIVCDNMDLSPGIVRIKRKGSDAGHNGIKSIIRNAGISEFARIYIGVGRPAGGHEVVNHVLEPFGDEDVQKFFESAGTAADAIISLTEKPINLVMNEVNKKNKPSESN